ncbi:histidinol-phosphatase [Spirosoma sp. RP8]|uniref:protein-tyrosine-phosphatase n=1 Tax=Spirosoma liriopis TaxID=2937440 RepID=A0ABT0HNL5_9BACT|nr:CpsB/CapC family capsule biosynthesis tyrosine phosphatase [Spirosoma liriopis]MCK8493764.1 histidinol-phosphatase [Spirosoma liriopis]
MLTKGFWQRFIPTRDAHAPTADACYWRVDMHSHMLPGIDDGVADLNETLTCLKQLADWGIQKVITTPHISRDWYPNSTADIRQGLVAVQELIAEHQLPLTIDVAAEYLLDDFFLSFLEQDDLLSFGEKRYLLVETGWASAPLRLPDILFRIQTHGYIPVLAHPERYKYYHADRNALAKIRETGCLFQLNWMSLCGRYGSQVEKQARFLLQQHWVDFIGSDMHRPNDLPAMEQLFKPSTMKLLEEQTLLNSTLLS